MIEFINHYILMIIILLPLIGAMIIYFIPHTYSRLQKVILQSFLWATFSIAVLIFMIVQSSGELDFTMHIPWIPQLGIAYSIGIDSISALFVICTLLICIMANLLQSHQHQRKYNHITHACIASMLLLCLMSLDMLLFSIAFTCSLIALYLPAFSLSHEKRISLINSGLLLTLSLCGLFILIIMLGHAFKSYYITHWYTQSLPLPLQTSSVFIAIGIFISTIAALPFSKWHHKLQNHLSIHHSALAIAYLLPISIFWIRVIIPCCSTALVAYRHIIDIIFMGIACISIIASFACPTHYRRLHYAISALIIIVVYALTYASGIATASTIASISCISIFAAAITMMGVLKIEHASIADKTNTPRHYQLIYIILIASLCGLPLTANFSAYIHIITNLFSSNPTMGSIYILLFCFTIISLLRQGHALEVPRNWHLRHCPGNHVGDNPTPPRYATWFIFILLSASTLAMGIFPNYIHTKLSPSARIVNHLRTPFEMR